LRWHWSYSLLIASLAISAVSTAFVWWVLGLRIDAADSFSPEPAAASWGGVALAVLGLSVLGMIVAVVTAARSFRGRHKPPALTLVD
jgi:hypothetical protein